MEIPPPPGAPQPLSWQPAKPPFEQMVEDVHAIRIWVTVIGIVVCVFAGLFVLWWLALADALS